MFSISLALATIGLGVCITRIQRNFNRDCAKPSARGLKEIAYIGMLEDVASVTYNATNPKIIDAFTMKASKYLYRIEGYNYSNGFTLGFTETDFAKKIAHVFNFLVFGQTAADKQNVDSLLGRKDLFVITKREGQFGEHEILGFATGMKVTGLTQDTNADNNGAYAIQLTAGEEVATPYTLKHLTSGTEDTSTWLGTLVAADA